MLGDKKILGICVTKIHDRVRGELLSLINYAAVNAGFKVICYNSFEDFFRHDSYGFGARTVYDKIDYDILDGLIICAQHFCDDELVDDMIARAKARQIPVVLLNGEREDCICIADDGGDAFRELLRHLFREHQIRDPFFLAGRKEKDPDTEYRLACYREVLQEFGLEFREDRMDYGEYWDGPAMEITERLAESGQLPDAMVCANDSMAFGVYRKLKELGYSIPEDVIVTGFDGIPAVKFYYPRLSTCQADQAGMANTCVEVFRRLFDGESCEHSYRIPYSVQLSESCGCGVVSKSERNEDASSLYHYLEDLEAHEDYVTSEVDHMLSLERIQDLYYPLSRFITQYSWFCIDSGFLKMVAGDSMKNIRSVRVPCLYDEQNEVKLVEDGQILPETEKWLSDKMCYIITSIYSKDVYCGYYVVKTDWINGVNYKIKKICRLANLVFNTVLNQFQQRRMMQEMENAVFVDVLTGLPNLKGISRWFESFSSNSRNHERSLSMALYSLPQYAYLNENYGIHEIEEVLVETAELLRRVYGREHTLAKLSENEFLVIHYGENSGRVSEENQRLHQLFLEELEKYNAGAGKNYVLEVSYGCTVADPGWTGSLGAFVKYASNELVLNRLQGEAILTKKKAASQIDYLDVFNLLLENNLFTYHFQPIVDAKTGDIYGYEALMRTTGGITLSPIQILDAASESGRLDEIEHFTFFNILQRYDRDFDKFQGRKVFINTIPNHFISAEECEELNRRYRKYMDCVVFEVTEQESSSDEEMEALKRFFGEGSQVHIAIDDFGTGHSNIVNLLRYAPQVIKIDHYLISGIDTDVNKQIFVKNTIEFAAMNQIKVLAEGVETAEELHTVIGFGVDLIQGFYTARPMPEPLDTIEERVRNEIIQENLTLSMYNNDKQKVYVAKDGENVNLIALALQKYTFVQISSGEVKLVGKKDASVSMVLRIADNADVKLRCCEANLTGTDEPAIQLGKGSNVELILEGYSAINKNGIHVPSNAKLKVTGNGNLLINSNDNECVGIGSRFDEPYGEIIFAHHGRVKVISSGDKIVGVGGGYGGTPIRILSGKVDVAGSGISVLGIGSSLGEAFINIGAADVTVKESGNEAVGIGTMKGTARIVSEGNVTVTTDSERTVAFGSLFGNNCSLKLEKGNVNCTAHCDNGVVVGSLAGSMKLTCNDCVLSVYGEGSQVTGLGSSNGNCMTEINGGIVDVKVLSGLGQPFGNEEDQIVITGGNVISRNDMEINARNAYGQKLHRHILEEDTFEKVIKSEYGEYVYTAERNKEHEILSVYLP